MMKSQYWAKIGIGIFGCVTRLVSLKCPLLKITGRWTSVELPVVELPSDFRSLEFLFVIKSLSENSRNSRLVLN